ncbi:MAG: L-seryl-tRNA(Sec) selenium transferase [Acidobacteriota bacterium]|nr:L-seryl-tRNA(Sec) selenium transferase [Blastocatellia bacterium]MDW8412272.1 L-seryl-tRNA(Sec) selenium transferase [Acidobacteriota bacterium]
MESPRQIRSVNYYLSKLKDLVEISSRDFTVQCIRQVLADLRREILESGSVLSEDAIVARIYQCWQDAVQSSLRRVINATGVIIHTNLGRSPLSEKAIQTLLTIARGYSNLEYDLQQGCRGKREVHSERLLQDILGCEAATVVNNCAAALVIALDELAKGGEVIISRGELIEIGGGFRIPEILSRSGAKLREVGTTNKTRVSDYERAINENTKLILRVHPSNYRITGFTERPTLESLVRLAEKNSLPLLEDLGSGCLVDLRKFSIDEPFVQASVSAGASLVTFSADKLLGGPQAGIIVGRRHYVDRIKSNPLMRALRVDKLTYAALEATLISYKMGRAWTEVPVLRMISTDLASLKHRSRRFIRRARRFLPAEIELDLLDGISYLGGGSAPQLELRTVLIALRSKGSSVAQLSSKLRSFDPPVIARVDGDRLLLDLRTVDKGEEDALLCSLQYACKK